MRITVKDVLEKILLPVSSGWMLERVEVDEGDKEIQVFVKYCLETVTVKEEVFSVYDKRAEREWRHLDLWEYKTVIRTRVPRYKDGEGKVRSVEVPWAEANERMSLLLEKKR